jgi:DNA-binding NarL/FixJ family response regulator
MSPRGHDGKATLMNMMKTKVLAAGAEAEQGREKAGAYGAPIRAVAVDNSPTILKMLSLLLEEESGVEIIGTATDGHQAVRRVVELEPDLVLMALRLQGMNGLEATRQIKARPHAPAVIMVTAEDTAECRAAARAAGTDGFVGKQHLLRKLPAAIRKLFSEARL